MTLWSPDTCKCMIQVNTGPYDWTDPRCTGVPISKCAVHQNVADVDLFNIVYMKENRPRNMLGCYIRDNHPELISANPDGDLYLAPYGISGTLTFDKDKNITLQIPGLSAKVQASLLAQFPNITLAATA